MGGHEGYTKSNGSDNHGDTAKYGALVIEGAARNYLAVHTIETGWE